MKNHEFLTARQLRAITRLLDALNRNLDEETREDMARERKVRQLDVEHPSPYQFSDKRRYDLAEFDTEQIAAPDPIIIRSTFEDEPPLGRIMLNEDDGDQLRFVFVPGAPKPVEEDVA